MTPVNLDKGFHEFDAQPTQHEARNAEVDALRADIIAAHGGGEADITIHDDLRYADWVWRSA